MANGTRSNVTPVVLREDTRPPAYGEKYSEGASRAFYVKYTEYKKRVAHANAGGAIQREVGVDGGANSESRAESFCSRVYHASRTITPTQLVVAVESHAGHGEGAEVELPEASAAVAKAVAMDSKGKTLLERVEPIMSNLEKFLASRQLIAALKGIIIPDLPKLSRRLW